MPGELLTTLVLTLGHHHHGPHRFVFLNNWKKNRAYINPATAAATPRNELQIYQNYWEKLDWYLEIVLHFFKTSLQATPQMTSSATRTSTPSSNKGWAKPAPPKGPSLSEIQKTESQNRASAPKVSSFY